MQPPCKRKPVGCFRCGTGSMFTRTFRRAAITSMTLWKFPRQMNRVSNIFAFGHSLEAETPCHQQRGRTLPFFGFLRAIMEGAAALSKPHWRLDVAATGDGRAPPRCHVRQFARYWQQQQSGSLLFRSGFDHATFDHRGPKLAVVFPAHGIPRLLKWCELGFRGFWA